jgi:hypothetical protein
MGHYLTHQPDTREDTGTFSNWWMSERMSPHHGGGVCASSCSAAASRRLRWHHIHTAPVFMESTTNSPFQYALSQPQSGLRSEKVMISAPEDNPVLLLLQNRRRGLEASLLHVPVCLWSMKTGECGKMHGAGTALARSTRDWGLRVNQLSSCSYGRNTEISPCFALGLIQCIRDLCQWLSSVSLGTLGKVDAVRDVGRLLTTHRTVLKTLNSVFEPSVVLKLKNLDLCKCGLTWKTKFVFDKQISMQIFSTKPLNQGLQKTLAKKEQSISVIYV